MRLLLLLALGCTPTDKATGGASVGTPNGEDAAGEDHSDSGTPAQGAGLRISFAPHWQWVGPGTARFRVETLDAVDLELTLTRAAGAADGSAGTGEVDETTVLLERSTVELTHYWPTPEPIDGVDNPDLPGPHHVHELVLDDLAPGEVVGWTLPTDIETLSGTLHAAPVPGDAFRAVFVGDTMSPWSDDVFARAAETRPELMLHGGDLQYQSNPIDTWAGLSWSMAPLSAWAAFQPAVGNHEHEGHDEFSQMYQRLFEELGTAPAPEGASYYRLDHGGVRFLALDSEGRDTHHISAPESLQVQWLLDELDDAADRADIHAVVAWFHRPIYTLGNHRPDTGMRAVLHPIFASRGVTMVLQAHNHSYERMVVDGVHYVTDGGGGALLYNVDGSVEDLPEEVDLRVAASQSFGFTLLDFADGAVELSRTAPDGTVVDSARIPLETPR